MHDTKLTPEPTMQFEAKETTAGARAQYWAQRYHEARAYAEAEHARAEALAVARDFAIRCCDTTEDDVAAMTRQRDGAYERCAKFIENIHPAAFACGDTDEIGVERRNNIVAHIRALASDAASAPSASPLSGALPTSGPGNREADPAAPAQGWRPIAEAPYETEILLWHPGSKYQPTGPVIGHITPMAMARVPVFGCTVYDVGDAPYWQPLPPPPASPASETAKERG